MSLFSNFPNLIHAEKFSASTMIPKEVQFMHQNGLNQSGVANFPIHFVLSVSGACNNRHNNPLHVHVIDTSDSKLDLERAANSN